MSTSSNDDDAILVDRDDVSNYNPEQILPQSPETIQKIRSWLQPTSYDIAGGEYRKHLASHVAGTGAWLTSSATYQDWLEGSEHGLLWIRGIPGSGKSVMAAKLIDEIAQANPGSPVLFFFFRQIIEANHVPQALLRDWMDQILVYSPPLQKQLRSYVQTNRPIESISMEDMWADLRTAFARLPGKVFCVADALDEVDRGHDAFLEALGTLGQWRPGKVKVLVTSRPVPRVERPLRKTPCLHLRLQENLVDVDISTFVQHTLSNSTIPRNDWPVITNAVPGRANGLFLYAKLAMDAFLEPGADINAVLSQLPADLNVLYTDLLNEHARRSGVAASIQHLILQSVTHATRPLRLLELAEMIRVNSLDDSKRDLRATKDLVRIACGPLLEILADETVSVVHHSFTEYLRGTTRPDDGSGYPILEMGPTHTQLALACLRYLRTGCLDDVEIKIKDDDDGSDSGDFGMSYARVCRDERLASKAEVQLRLKHPFFEYASSNWHHHVNRSEAAGYDQAEVNRELRGFLANDRSVKAWLQIKWPGQDQDARLVTQLHIAAKAGLVSYTRELLKTMEVDVCDVYGKTPLWWAAAEGHSAAIRALIAAGANPDQDDAVHGLKPLHEAAGKNHHEVVRALLETGVDPLTPKSKGNPGRSCVNVPTSCGHTPLMYACKSGHLESVEAFLPFLKDIEAVHRALSWSAAEGRAKLVSRILQHPGVDVNAKVRGATSLYLACSNPDIATITTLLQAGANSSIMCRDPGTEFGGIGASVSRKDVQNCLHRISGLGHGERFYKNKLHVDDWVEIFPLLIEAGVDIHQRTPSGRTALHGAVSSPVLTRLLLDAGADANATDLCGSAPLHRASKMDSIAFLIEQGHADIDIKKDDDGRTPLLHMLSTCYRNEAILKFLEYGPNCNAIDNKGNGALHIALGHWSTKPNIIRALLEGGADPNLKNRDGLTPLLLQKRYERPSTEIVDLLLEWGVDINAADRNGATQLFRVVSESAYSTNVIGRLIDRGASTSVRDYNGRTCLHEAVRSYDAPSRGEVKALDVLVGLGLDIKVVDHRGNGLLHELALRRSNHTSYRGSEVVSFWERILAMGLDLEQKNYVGRTPLHILCAANMHDTRFKQGDIMPIDLVISRTRYLDTADKDGITPLHIAVTGGELYTKKLLDAGADAAACTAEGLTPLHLASRCRESNVVGLLLDALRRRSHGTSAGEADSRQIQGTDTIASSAATPALKPVPGVNARAFGRSHYITPLFYACRSGRPETVSLLLEAGADDEIGRTFDACIGFEEEDILWKVPCQPADCDGAVALKLKDTSRRSVDKPLGWRSDGMVADETARLGEILDMLAKHGGGLCHPNGRAWASQFTDNAVVNDKDYTAKCLIDAESHSAPTKRSRVIPPTVAHEFPKQVLRSLREASVQALNDFELVKPGYGNRQLLRRFLVRREYHLVEQLAHMGVDFLPNPKDQVCNFAVLVRHGFASLVEKIGTLQAESRLERGDWHAFGDKTRPGLWFAKRDLSEPKDGGKNPMPFLLEAVRRDLPNMEVVRLLVEKFGVDINELQYTYEYEDREYKAIPSDSALHSVAVGESWWHVRQALPYLIKAGADISVRDYNGQTPLHVALHPRSDRPGPFHKEAARILIEAGADVNAVDDKKRSCLARAQHDVDTIKLLKSHGATVTADAIFAAIDAKNVGVLQALLSGGGDANMRRDKPPEEPAKKRKKRPGFLRILDSPSRLDPQEEFPLYRAGRAMHLSLHPRPQRLDPKTENELVQVLLDHGANPFAKFSRRNAHDDGVSDTDTQGPEVYEECTVVHELLCEKGMVDNILRLPGLDVNHRDASGRTLLHAACYRGSDYILSSDEADADNRRRDTLYQRLISRGARLDMQDNLGRNILHCMIGRKRAIAITEYEHSFSDAIGRAPHLANQADCDGKTPLHYAAKRGYNNILELLLSAGADARAVDKSGSNALHMTAPQIGSESGRTKFLNLAGRGVNVNGRNALGETPIFARGKGGGKVSVYIQTAKEAGVDFFARDNSGRGLLHLAASESVELFKELLDIGLDPMLEDDAQRTAIDVAAASGNQEVLALFEKKD